MESSNMRVSASANDEPPERERIDAVEVVVIAALFAWYVARALVPAVVSGARLGLTALTGAFLSFALAAALLPMWRQRRVR